MALSKRERLIAIGVGAALGIWALDSYAVQPYSANLKSIETQIDVQNQKKDDAEQLFARERHLRKVWHDLQQGGVNVDPSQAESQTYQALLDWSQASGVTLNTVKPERALQERQFEIIGFNVTANGSMQSISTLLWALETATIPIRVNDVQITPRTEGKDDLSLRLSVSALCMPPQNSSAGNTGGGR